MKLLDIIKYLVSPSKLEEFYREQGIGEDTMEADKLCIYMIESLSLDSDIKLFSFEETEGRTQFQKDNINYVYVLEVDLAIDLIASDLDLKFKGVTDKDRADRILHYAIYDA